MSIKISNAVWEHSKQNGNALVLLLKLADNAADDGFCWPGIAHLAERARTSTRTVIRTVKKLEADNELFVCRNRRHGNKYIVRVGLSDAEFEASFKKHFPFLPADMCQNVISEVTQLCHIRSDTAMSQEPSLNHQEPSHVATATPAQDDAKEETPVYRCRHCLQPTTPGIGGCSVCGATEIEVFDAKEEPSYIDLPPIKPFYDGGPDGYLPPAPCVDAAVRACDHCGKLGATTADMPDVHNACTCKQESALVDVFGERPERRPPKPVEHWTTQAAKAWATWGAESKEFQRQLQRFGESGRIVQELGYKLQEATGLKPLWGTPKKVKWWSSGLWELYEEAGHSIPVAIEAVRALKKNKDMTVASPYSFVNTARALAADKGTKPARIVIR